MIFSVKARVAQLCRPQISLGMLLVAPLLLPTALTGSRAVSAKKSDPSDMQQRDKSEQSPPTNVHSYVDKSIEELTKSVSELATLQPATDQQVLPMILEKIGERVDDLFDGTFVNLSATEVISERRRVNFPKPDATQEDRYDYFIVRRGTLVQKTIEEYRLDAEENESPPGLGLLTSGFASSVMYFSKHFQAESTYRYLGEQKIGTRNACAVAFAQIPAKATISVRLRKIDGRILNLLVQGIVWVDTSNFQILQMRTDLLAPEIVLGNDEREDKLKTLVTFSEVQPAGIPTALWLPSEAQVHAEIEYTSWDSATHSKEFFFLRYRNVHRFTNYQSYGGSKGHRATEVIGQENQEAHPYLEQPLKELVKRIPELKSIRPASDQQKLSSILQKTGAQVDEFFSNLVDLIAREEITQERLIHHDLPSGMPGGLFPVTERVRDSYLILRRKGNSGARINEFRMDALGNRVVDEGIDKGFFVTSGFALSSVHFSTAFQWDSRFLLLGDQKIDRQDTYVVAFAQIPGEAHNTVTMVGRHGFTVHLLTQGIAWVDKRNFHILRMRTDLLARQPEIGLKQQTAKIRFSEVRFGDVPVPLWLPRDVDVNLKFADPAARQHGVNSREPLTFGVFDAVFRNIHRYTNYRRYRVSTKMLTPQ
jgi:hypothetical protein